LRADSKAQGPKTKTANVLGDNIKKLRRDTDEKRKNRSVNLNYTLKLNK